jgi:hypothetical protein
MPWIASHVFPPLIYRSICPRASASQSDVEFGERRTIKCWKGPFEGEETYIHLVMIGYCRSYFCPQAVVGPKGFLGSGRSKSEGKNWTWYGILEASLRYASYKKIKYFSKDRRQTEHTKSLPAQGSFLGTCIYDSQYPGSCLLYSCA